MNTVAVPPIQSVMPWRSSVQFVEEITQPIEWLIPHILPTGAVVLLSGREGSMKSWLALSMAGAVAAGVSWLGHQTKQGRVLYLDGEMPKAVMQDRLEGIGLMEALDVWSWTDATFPSQLNHKDLQQAAREHSLIVVDTLRRQMGSLRENNADEMAQITKALRELTRYGAAVLVLHHAPKDLDKQDYRGSTELGAGVDVVLTLTKKTKKSGAVLTLDTRKTRYSLGASLEIDAKKGDHAPVFALWGTHGLTPWEAKASGQEGSNKDLSQLALRVNELRERLGRDPIQHEVIQAANTAKLGGKDTIRRLLKEGEGQYWREQTSGRTVSYAPLDTRL